MKIKQIFNKKLLGPITLLHLLVLGTISVVFGAVVLYYDWTMTLTAGVPDVRFYEWSSGIETNTITMSYNIYEDVWTIDNNASYGIRNNALSGKTVYLWVESCSDPSIIGNFTVQVLEPSGTPLCTWTTTDFSNTGEVNAVSWFADGEETYTFKNMVRGLSSLGEASVSLSIQTGE